MLQVNPDTINNCFRGWTCPGDAYAFLPALPPHFAQYVGTAMAVTAAAAHFILPNVTPPDASAPTWWRITYSVLARYMASYGQNAPNYPPSAALPLPAKPPEIPPHV